MVLATADGIAIRFSCRDVRNMGRRATGVKGIALRHGDTVVACLVLKEDSPAIMTISALGFGKRTNVDLYRVQSRGGRDHQLQGHAEDGPGHRCQVGA